MSRFEIPNDWDVKEVKLQLKLRKIHRTMWNAIGVMLIALATLRCVNSDADVIYDAIVLVLISFQLDRIKKQIDVMKRYIKFNDL